MPASCLPVPHLEQNLEVDCLPTCIAMILAYLHEPVDVTRIARLLDTQEFGSIASRIHRLAEWNYEVTYQSGSLARLHACLDAAMPVIVFVWTGDLPYWNINTPHALVVVGVDDEIVQVNDPALSVAPQSIPAGDFLLAWAEFDNRYATIARR